MATSSYEQIPANLNIRFRKGDSFELDMRFNIDLTGYTFDCQINSIPLTITSVDVPNGRIKATLSSFASSGITVGTYDWFFKWTVSSLVRSVIIGSAEVVV